MIETLSIIVTFIAALTFGFLSNRSSKRDWDFIKGWPAFVLLFISLLSWQIEYSVAQASIHRADILYKCETLVNDLGISTKDCNMVIVENNQYSQELARQGIQSLIDWLKKGFFSILYDIPLEAAGFWIGMIVSRKVIGQSQPN
jgi:hypothetical protein